MPHLTWGIEVVKTDADGDPLHEYAPNGDVVYRVYAENTGHGYAVNTQLKVPVDSVLSSDNQPVFEDWSVDIEPGIVKTSHITGDYTGNVILDAIANIAPREKYSFLVKARVRAEVTGTVTNVLSVNNDSTSIDLLPGGVTLLSTQTADTAVYQPGQKVTVTLQVTNHSDSIGKADVQSAFGQIDVLTVDGTKKPVFDDTRQIHMACTIEGDQAVSTFSEPVMTAVHGLNTQVVLAVRKTGQTPEYSSLICTMSGVVRDDAVGDFTSVAVAGGNWVDLGYAIKPVEGNLSMTSQASSPVYKNYQPGDSAGFDMAITNTGPGYVTSARFESLLSDVLAECSGQVKPDTKI